MKKIGLIPCRLNSTRLPNKPLKIIEGLPMFAHVYFRSLMSHLDEVYICTDSEQIMISGKELGIECILTKTSHNNGTERCAEAASLLNLKATDIIVDIQGDEPMVNPNHINSLLDVFQKRKCEILLPHLNCEDYNNQNIVKILSGINDKIIYMSRSDIPNLFRGSEPLKKHLSIIAFTTKSILDFVSFSPSKYEKMEGIELLRAIENRMDIQTMELEGETKAVDTYEDLVYVREEMKYDKLIKLYNTL